MESQHDPAAAKTHPRAHASSRDLGAGAGPSAKNAERRPGATLVTGATGFIGGELVKHLVTASDRQLICPIRADSGQHAERRGAARLTELFGTQSRHVDAQIRWIPGDVEEARLAWSTETWIEVAAACSEIFHCAGSTSVNPALDDAHRINVDGTRHVYELAEAAARHGQFRRFHHVSTAFVSGVVVGEVDAHHLPSDRATNFRNTHERTKARAERWLRWMASHRVPVTIHRPSIVTGSARPGATAGQNVLSAPLKMVSQGRLPVFSAGRHQNLDVVGAKFVVEAMALFADLDRGPLVAHHLTAGSSLLEVDQVVAAIAEATSEAGAQPIETRLLPPWKWRLLVAGVRGATRLPRPFTTFRQRAQGLRRTVDECSDYVPYTRVGTLFDAAEEHRVLALHGIDLPAASVNLDRLVQSSLATQFDDQGMDLTDGPSRRGVNGGVADGFHELVKS